MSPGIAILALLLGSFAAAAAGVRAFVRWAGARRLLDVPNERSSHEVPTPRGAGVVIVAVVGVAMAGLSAFVPFNARAVAAAALVVAGVSAVDDVWSLATWLRLVVHAGCAVVAAVGTAPSAGAVASPFAFALAVLWIVGLTNAYNFMDGVDGIAGAQAVVTGATIALAGSAAGLWLAAGAGAAIAGAAAGFLVYNWPPARVFMGDVGSAFVGFAFACLVLQIGAGSLSLAAAIVLSLWPFLFDTSLTLLRRATRGENILASHRSHLYQRLVICGWTHRRVSILYAVLAAAGAGTACWWALGGVSWMVLFLVPAMAAGLWILVRRTEDTRRASPAGAGASAGPRA